VQVGGIELDPGELDVIEAVGAERIDHVVQSGPGPECHRVRSNRKLKSSGQRLGGRPGWHANPNTTPAAIIEVPTRFANFGAFAERH
jgi:hypothetical protein